jgi:ABC-type Fe3+/spermidine/putrescine transport system ATPase subunit
VRLEDGTLVRADTGAASGRVAAGVRPEKVALSEAGANRLPGTVRESAYIGVATEIVVDTPAGDISVFHQNSEAGGLVPALGTHVTVSWAPESTFVVDRGEESPA